MVRPVADNRKRQAELAARHDCQVDALVGRLTTGDDEAAALTRHTGGPAEALDSDRGMDDDGAAIVVFLDLFRDVGRVSHHKVWTLRGFVVPVPQRVDEQTESRAG